MNDLIAQIFSYFHGIWAYRWSALVVAWLVAIPGWTVVYLLPDLYTSTAIMHIDTRSMIQPLLKGLAVDTKVEKGLGAVSRRLFNEGNMKQIVEATDLRAKATSDEAMARITYEVASKLTLESIGGVSKDKKKEAKAIYMLSFEGRSPELVYQIVSASLDSLVKSTLKSARTDTSSAQEFLDEQIADYENRLNVAEQNVAEFQRENIGMMPGEAGGNYSKLQREQETLDELKANKQLAEKRLANMRRQLNGEIPVSGDGQEMVKLREYRKQLQVLLTQFTESHPDVQTLRANISDLLSSQSGEPVYIKKGAATELNPAYQNLKSNMGDTNAEISALKGKINEQTAKVELLRSSVSLIPEVEAKLARLNRDYELTHSRYLKLVERKELAQLAQAVGDSGKNVNFRIIAAPAVAEEPSGPDRALLMSIILAAAIAAGLGWGVVKFALQPTFIYVRQLDDQIGLPILGTVGLYMTPWHRRKRKMQLFSYLLVFSLLIVAYSVNMYLVLGIEIDDILQAFESTEI